MFLNKLSKSFLYAIGGILELYTFSLIENCVSMHVLLQNINKNSKQIPVSLINRLQRKM